MREDTLGQGITNVFHWLREFWLADHTLPCRSVKCEKRKGSVPEPPIICQVIHDIIPDGLPQSCELRLVACAA